MTVKEAITAFRNGVFNEIFHSSANEDLQDTLINGIKQVEKTVIETYEASKKKSLK